MSPLSVYFLLCFFFVSSLGSKHFTTEDVFIPDECESIAKPGDHILLEYTVVFANGTEGSSLRRPAQLYHVLLETTVL
jgi:hypothetical protein